MSLQYYWISFTNAFKKQEWECAHISSIKFQYTNPVHYNQNQLTVVKIIIT